MAQMENGEEKTSPIIKICEFIVDKRMLFFLIYIILIIFSVIARNWVGVENSLSYYLPTSTETKQGLDVMDKQFTTFGSAKVMVANISYDDAKAIKKDLEGMPGVQGVTFTDDDADEEDFRKYYNNGSALFNVTFDYDEDDDRALEALSRVEDRLSAYDIYVSTSMGNQQGDIITEEINKIMVLVAGVVITVLLITTQSLGEIPVLGLTFVASLIVNSGTNFLYGTISFVSNSVCAILQLALSVDYAIMYCNRFKEEKANGYDTRDAAVISLSKSIPEILSSSLTTIGGLFAMMFMQYGIGSDLGRVLIKSILMSLVTVFTLMPGLLVLFSKRMEKTQHKNLVPKITGIGRMDYKLRRIVPFGFLAVFIATAVLSQLCPYVYGYDSLKTPVQNSVEIARDMINDNFGEENFVAIVVPGRDYKTEARLIADLESQDYVDHCQGLANTNALGDYNLTDTLTPRQFSELMDVDYEVCEMLYSAYAADQEEYGRVVGGVAQYRVVLMDMLGFLNDMVEDGYVTLGDDVEKTLKDANTQIDNGRKQLQGDDYDRILCYLSVPLPQEDENTFNVINTIHDKTQSYYEDGTIYVVGNATSERDLRDTYQTDNIVVSVVSILFVLVVLLFTFKSAGLPVLLIFVIEGAIFCNFAYPKLANEKLFFMSYLIVSSIQMGANIDYAIAISTRYTEMRKDHAHSRKESIIEALNFAFPTIVTSGSMMIFSGLFIGQMTSDACISSIGQCLARGTSISVLLVLFVLPELLVVGDKIIEKTTFDIARPIHMRDERGRVLVNGTIRGTINGRVIGSMNAIVLGEVKAVVVSGNVHSEEDADADVVDLNDPARQISVREVGSAGRASDEAEDTTHSEGDPASEDRGSMPSDSENDPDTAPTNHHDENRAPGGGISSSAEDQESSSRASDAPAEATDTDPVDGSNVNGKEGRHEN